MSEMVEQVARALRDADDQRGKYEPWLHWQEMARAAIAAMHEPTQAMLDAGDRSPQDHDTGLVPYSVWTHMVDEALK